MCGEGLTSFLAFLVYDTRYKGIHSDYIFTSLYSWWYGFTYEVYLFKFMKKFLYLFIFLTGLFFSTEVYATHTIDNFSTYSLGNICSQSPFTCNGVNSGVVQNSTIYGFPNALKYSTFTNLGADNINREWDQPEINPIIGMALYVPTGTVGCVSQLNASSTIFSFVCTEAGGNLYVNGADSSRDYPYDEWFTIEWEVSTTSNQSRVKVGTSTWSGWKNYGISDKDLEDIQFSSDGSSNFMYVDSIVHIEATTTPDVEIITLPDWKGNVSIEADGAIQFDYENYCTIGESCRIWFNYNPTLVNHDIYLTNNNGNERTDWENSVDHTKLTSGLLMQDYLTPTTQTVAITDDYCLYDQHPDMDVEEDLLYCGIKVNWVFESTVLDDYFSEYDCDTICDGIATGTDWFNFRYGIECGARKTLCWGFVPNNDTMIKFAKAVYTIQNAFPFTIFTQIQETIQEKSFSTSSKELAINFTDLLGVEGFDTDLPVLTATNMQDTFGDLWTKIYTLMEYIVYIFGFVFLVYEIVRFNKRKLSK